MLDKDFYAEPDKNKASYNLDFVLKEMAYSVSKDCSAERHEKVTQPIIITGSRIGVFRNAKLIPTARASMLVATASTKSIE